MSVATQVHLYDGERLIDSIDVEIGLGRTDVHLSHYQQYTHAVIGDDGEPIYLHGGQDLWIELGRAL